MLFAIREAAGSVPTMSTLIQINNMQATASCGYNIAHHYRTGKKETFVVLFGSCGHVSNIFGPYQPTPLTLFL